jgi:hypothetical protein
MSKKYEITIKYLDGQVETTTIITSDINWSLKQFIRNRKLFSELNVELKENDKE